MDVDPLKLHPRSQAQVIVEVIMTTLIMVSAILGNSLVCLAVYRTRRLRTIPNTFIVSLAATDLLLVTTVLPVLIQTQSTGAWIQGPAYCEFQAFQSIYLFAVSLFTLTAISINRYFKIVKREKYDVIFHKRSVIAIVVSIWSVAALLCLGPLIEWGRYKFDALKSLCSFDENSSVSFRTTATVVIVVNMIAILACNIMISMSVRKHRRQMQPKIEVQSQGIYGSSSGTAQQGLQVDLTAQQGLQVDLSISSAPNVASNDVGVHHPRVGKDPRETRGEDVHIARTISLVVLLFFLSWLPNLILDNLVSSGVHVAHEVRMFGVYAVFLDSVINPVIYGVRNRGFRKAFKDIFKHS